MEELYSSLKVIETERIAQVDQIKLKYKEIKVSFKLLSSLNICAEGS